MENIKNTALFIVLIVVLSAALSGCSTIAQITDKAANVNDEALVAAEFTICSAASVGAVQRRYNTQELIEARKVICDREMVVAENE